MDFIIISQDQYGKFNKVPEWQRLAGKAAKEVEKFAKEKVDLVLMHWRDRMGIAQKEVKTCFQTSSSSVYHRFAFIVAVHRDGSQIFLTEHMKKCYLILILIFI